MRILIADGSVVLRERLVSLLSELAGVEMVGQAQNAIETLTAVQSFDPDVVILDTRMRGGSGIEVLKYAKQHRPSRVVMILTDQPYQQYRKKCLESGATFFFSKSFELKLLVGTVKELAGNSDNYRLREGNG